MENKTKKIGVLGYGEVGKAIASFYEDPSIQDIASGKSFAPDAQFDVIHICIPYGNAEEFHQAVRQTIVKHGQGSLVFVHTTAGVGTTLAITEYHTHTVHAPVRGVHPNLALGIKTFPMFVGADSAGAARLAGEHLTSIGIEPRILHRSETTELLKLLDTTYYGVCIAFHAYAEKLCKELELPFQAVMTGANETYNAGYTALGKPNVVRPVLFPPEGGKIGGHCVIPNAEILREQFGDDALLETILRHK